MYHTLVTKITEEELKELNAVMEDLFRQKKVVDDDNNFNFLFEFNLDKFRIHLTQTNAFKEIDILCFDYQKIKIDVKTHNEILTVGLEIEDINFSLIKKIKETSENEENKYKV